MLFASLRLSSLRLFSSPIFSLPLFRLRSDLNQVTGLALEGFGLRTVDISSLQLLAKLQTLSLSDGERRGNTMPALPDAIGTLTQLTTLNLDGCRSLAVSDEIA
jgi:Leucine-rich repeat (LRR) protein